MRELFFYINSYFFCQKCISSQNFAYFCTENAKGITFFNIGQTELSPKEKLRLDIIATQIKNAPKNKIYVIEGHADPQTGSKAVNTRLAEQRAKKVYDYLISKGVKAENLQYKGYSDTKSPFKTEQENRVTVIR